MSRTRWIVTLVVVTAFVSAGVGGVLGGATAQQQPTESGESQTVSVSGVGSASAPPDRAVVRLAVVAIAEDAETAREMAAADADRMRRALRKAGVADEQVRTITYTLQTEYRRDETEPQRFRVTHGYEVELDDIDAAGSVVDVAVGNGADRVDGVRFDLSEAALREVRDRALTEAMTEARADADAVAAAAGVGVTTVESVHVGGRTVPVLYARETVATDAAGTVVEPGPVDVRVTVEVVYAMR